MTTLELGACFRLLCRQWFDGFIPDDETILVRLCRLDTDSMAKAWVTLAPFFPVIEPGKRANQYMWIERDKVVAYLEKKSDEGTRAAKKRWDEVRKKRGTRPNGSPMSVPMQDQTRADQSRPEEKTSSEQSCSDGGKALPNKSKRVPSDEATKLSVLLKTEIRSNKPDYRITPRQERSWAITADRMLRLDARKFEEVAKIIRWSQRDEFWMSNVLSMDTLREKFDQLSLKAKISTHPTRPQTLPDDYVPASEQIKRERQHLGATQSA